MRPREVLGERDGFFSGIESDAHHITVGNLPPGGARRIEPLVVEPAKGG
jgi:hypothetical protein